MLERDSSDRTKYDKDFYEIAGKLQTANKLPVGCSSEDFGRKAIAFIFHIMPNLARPYTSMDEAADYIVDLLPESLAADGRRIQDVMKREGTYSDLMLVVRKCKDLVLATQKKPTPTPAFVCNGEFHGFPVAALAQTAGVNLSVSGVEDKAFVAGSGGGTKWCPKCPKHGRKGDIGPDRCLYNPNFDGTCPPSIWSDAERKRDLFKARADKAREHGVVWL